ncbi:sensor histidine kinase [Kribbella sp. CA-293567]|uniref:sensor histidine kinase n=1 Tax=Kribbella sp. CA-293567 TaxID=3002436 RepID=UPI0022DD0487|nr:histidine kinase [Kribbella sp. CA-293567]WBQ06233.1 histidine kinase [Kribbella sp. CA-293567]
MVPVPRWWLDRSRAERFDITLRWPLYAVSCGELLLATLVTVEQRGLVIPGAVLFLLVVAAHATANLLLLRAAIDRYLTGAPVSGRLIAVATALTLAGLLAADVAFPRFSWGGGDADIHLLVSVVLMGALTFALTPMLRWVPLLSVILAGAAVTGAASLQLEPAIAYAFWAGFLIFTCRVSVWTLSLGWEIDRSRAVGAQLAIAEERLRFARDLHDTLGHNLSLVAVRSELAAALATRGDATAADQMLDVRQIAHDSLREMRAVVSGYRTTDLASELAGAQSVLRSAGVNCRVIGDGSALPPATQAALGWVVREGTTNVIQHSNATVCKIELDLSMPDVLFLRMENDGVQATRPGDGGGRAAGDGGGRAAGGNDGRAAGGSGGRAAGGNDGSADGATGGGTGIAGLRERLGSLGGTLTVAAPAGRFILVVQLPVPR